MDKDEFLRLIEKYCAEQYDSLEEYFESEHSDLVLSDIVKEMRETKYETGVSDLTNAKMSDIQIKAKSFNNFKIGNFLIKAKRKNEKLDITIYETINKMDVKVNVLKDNRFTNASWSKYWIHLNMYKEGTKIPPDELASIIKWIQSIQKMSAFI